MESILIMLIWLNGAWQIEWCWFLLFLLLSNPWLWPFKWRTTDRLSWAHYLTQSIHSLRLPVPKQRNMDNNVEIEQNDNSRGRIAVKHIIAWNCNEYSSWHFCPSCLTPQNLHSVLHLVIPLLPEHVHSMNSYIVWLAIWYSAMCRLHFDRGIIAVT